MKYTLIIICLFLALGHSGRAQDQMSAPEALRVLYTAQGKLYDTEKLKGDSCIHINMRITNIPTEGEPLIQTTELYTGRYQTHFRSDYLEEHVTKGSIVRIWPEDKFIIIADNTSGVLDKTRAVLEQVNGAIEKNGVVNSSAIVIDRNGSRILNIEIRIRMQQLGGVVIQKTAINLDQLRLIETEIVLPEGNPIHSMKTEYLLFEYTTLPKTDSFINGLLAQQAPVTEYKEHKVNDLRIKK